MTRTCLWIGAVCFLLGAASAPADAQTYKRDHRKRDKREARDDRYPNSAPPAAKRERVRPKRGHVWVNGHWDWQAGAWAWVNGHYEREAAGKRWRDHRWEQQGGKWVRHDGGWEEDKPAPRRGPTSAPPQRRRENARNRRGHVWVAGQWDWDNNKWNWVAGHYEREAAGKRWRDQRWEQQGGQWVRIDGGWEDAPVDTYRGPRSAPPAPRRERVRPRRGQVWIAGHWDWQNNKWNWVGGQFARQPRGKRWRDHRWEQQGTNQWVRVDGGWEDDLPSTGDYNGPTSAPPALKNERVRPRAGHVWVGGHWDWQNARWTWVGGHFEREQTNRRWRADRWEQHGQGWVRHDGGWENDGPTSAPPPPRRETRDRSRAGHTWVAGRWEWKNGKYEWTAGGWQRDQRGKSWVEGRWDRQGNNYVWIDGHWQ